MNVNKTGILHPVKYFVKYGILLKLIMMYTSINDT